MLVATTRFRIVRLESGKYQVYRLVLNYDGGLVAAIKVKAFDDLADAVAKLVEQLNVHKARRAKRGLGL